MYYYIKTFGCQMNVSDSETVIALLEERGFSVTENYREADLLIVNTCSVREKAEVTAEHKIRELGSIKKKGGLLWVIGCMAERVGDALIERQPKIDRVIGAPELEFIEDQIDTFLAPLGEFQQGRVPAENSYSAFLPIMRGCDNFCTFCIVPHVRGREHSISVEKLVESTKKLVAKGAGEITLLGQNVNSYSSEDLDFPDLLACIHEVEGVERLRFTSPHPKDLSDKLITAISELPKVANTIHLPVQAGSSEVLKRMNRSYTREEYLERVTAIRAVMPNIDITTDVMVGFPGETDEQFEETITLFQEVRFTSAFMFAFSPREGTGAAKYTDQINKETKTKRLNRLIDLQTKITKECYADMVGKEVEVYPTLNQNSGRGWIGQDYGSKRVVIESKDELGGTIIRAKITKTSGMTLISEII